MNNIIPKPSKFLKKAGSIQIGDIDTVYSDFDLKLFRDSRDVNSKIKIHKDASLTKEAYRVSIENDEVNIYSLTKTGAYYALNSLRFLTDNDGNVPCVEIEDEPAYEWRGLSLDESRHFFGKDSVKELLDEMFELKLNVFHWHLTDDNGWRIEIKKYPLLTEIGSKRKYTQIGGWLSSMKEEKEYSGFYTQEDIKEIVAYADERGISILPEIDVPAHFAAALAAYPKLGCRGLQRDVPGYFGSKIPFMEGVRDWNRPCCIGKKETIDFILDVYSEVIDLFPFEYFHVGGDECDVSEWKECPDCKALMKEKGFTKEQDLQSYLTNILCEFLESKGKHMLAWNDVLRKGIDNINKDVLIQQWLPGQDKNTIAFAKAGGKVLMSNHKSFYFDMPYAMYPLKNTYDFKPSTYGLDRKHIIGVEGEIWTEWIRVFEKVQFMSHPRMEALAEVAWSASSSRDYDNFKERFELYKETLERRGICYANESVYEPSKALQRLFIKFKFKSGDPDLEYKSR